MDIVCLQGVLPTATQDRGGTAPTSALTSEAPDTCQDHEVRRVSAPKERHSIAASRPGRVAVQRAEEWLALPSPGPSQVTNVASKTANEQKTAVGGDSAAQARGLLPARGLMRAKARQPTGAGGFGTAGVTARSAAKKDIWRR